MRRWKTGTAWNLIAFAALSTVVASASPAGAAVPSTTAVQASSSSATVGQPVDLTTVVTCTGDPSGGLGMTFFDGPDILDTVPVAADGTSAYFAKLSTVGAHTITAAYNGNENCGASNAKMTVAVSAAPTPPAPPSGGFCLLACGGLINFSAGDVHNELFVNSVRGRSSTHHP